MSGATTVAAGALLHSIRARGLHRALIFAALGLGTGATGEYLAVNVVRAVRHHTRPQVLGVPVSAVLSWYSITYAAFTAVDGALPRRLVGGSGRVWAVSVGTGALATSLDLMLDCYGLDSGFWEWPRGGAYATEFSGPNRREGIPPANFVAWFAMTGAISLAYLRATANREPARAASSHWVHAGALLLVPYYLTAAAWAIRKGHRRYLAYSGLVPVVGAIGLRGALDHRRSVSRDRGGRMSRALEPPQRDGS